MNCAKCGAGNLDGAEFCGLCFESFKPKTVIPAAKAQAAPLVEAPPAPRHSRAFIAMGGAVSFLLVLGMEMLQLAQTGQTAVSIMEILSRLGIAGGFIFIIGASIVVVVEFLSSAAGGGRAVLYSGVGVLGLCVAAGAVIYLHRTLMAEEKEDAAKNNITEHEFKLQDELRSARYRLSAYHYGASAYPREYPPDVSQSYVKALGWSAEKWAPKPVNLPPYHGKSTKVWYGTKPNDQGGWMYNNVMYNNVQPDYHFGKLWINCTHTDSRGMIWAVY